MSPIEFLYRLEKISPETGLNLAQLGLMIEMMSNVLNVSLEVNAIHRDLRLRDEMAFSSWIAEPIATVQSWRFSPPKINSLVYRLGSVREWILAHIKPLRENSSADLESISLDATEITACWKSHLPIVTVGGKYIDFFRCLEEETEPDDYEIVDDNFVALEVAKMSRGDVTKVAESLEAHGKFGATIRENPADAQEIYATWKSVAMPAVELQFFRTALVHNNALASEIAGSIGRDLIRQHFNPASWLWGIFSKYDFCKLNPKNLIEAFELTANFGIQANTLGSIRDHSGKVLFNGSVSHLFADHAGDVFSLPRIDQCETEYREVLNYLLVQGLNIKKENNDKLTALDIADESSRKYGLEGDLFNRVCGKYELHRGLAAGLKEKNN